MLFIIYPAGSLLFFQFSVATAELGPVFSGPGLWLGCRKGRLLNVLAICIWAQQFQPPYAHEQYLQSGCFKNHTNKEPHKVVWSHKKLNISHDFFCIQLNLGTVVTLITKIHDTSNCDISMATQWAPGFLHSKGKSRVFLLQEVLLAVVVYSVGVS